MKISMYVHDFQPQVGHSRAMIELFNGLLPDQKDKVTHFEVVAFTSAPLEDILPDFKCKKVIRIVPFNFLKPFILKVLFYHLYSFLHSIFIASSHKKIGIGIASLNVDIINIQFVHRQWDTQYFDHINMGGIKKLYKKILFVYFSICEDYIYTFKAKNIDFIVIAKFMKKFLADTFHTPESSMHMIPSGVNVKEFNFSTRSNEELYLYLRDRYPVLKNLDCTKPVSLFVGAYERKGLDVALEAMAKFPENQFIIIGKPEQFSNFVIPKNLNCFLIEFTKEVQLFYQLADQFIFPTKYEPFGLVIIEAYVMGLDLVIPRENAGASEIIPETEGIFFVDPMKKINLPKPTKISIEKKIERRNARLKNIEQYSWKNASKTFYSILFKY
jgi:glycosyltransferase involved in cell wall biosynthesis